MESHPIQPPTSLNTSDEKWGRMVEDVDTGATMSANSYFQPQFASSRKSKTVQKRLLQHTLLFGGLGAVICVLFFTVILPGLVGIAGSLSTNTTSVVDDSLPPAPPELSAPVNATFSAQVNLQGYSVKGNKVVILKNDQELQQVPVQDDGSFSLDVPLDKGQNTFAAYAIDSHNKVSEKTENYSVLYKTDPPKLDISQPQDKQSIQGKKNQTLAIIGTTDKGTKIYINDRFVYPKDDGTFNTQIHLSDGDNNFDIKAIDQAGNMTEKKITVTFTE